MIVKTNDNMIISRVLELQRESEYSVTVSGFMSPGEINQTYKELLARIGNEISGCFFWGGCRGAERCTAVFLPEWYRMDNPPLHKLPGDSERTDSFALYLCEHPELIDEIPVKCLRVRGSGFRELTHRDFMGAVLSLGIERNVIGDIAVISENEALVFCLSKIAPYLASELTMVGQDAVKTEITEIAPDYVIPRRFEDIPIIVMSPRLDGIVKAITGKSREDAAAMVRAGLVELSYIETDDVSSQVNEGDILSIRGYGKYVIGGVSGQTKSGRVRIMCRKYL